MNRRGTRIYSGRKGGITWEDASGTGGGSIVDEMNIPDEIIEQFLRVSTVVIRPEALLAPLPLCYYGR